MKFIFVNIMMGMYRGGGENFDLNLSRELTAQGHEIEFYHLRPLLGKTRFPLPDYCTSHPVRAPWLYLWTQYLQGLPVIGRLRGLRGLPRTIGQAIFELRTLLLLWRRRHESFVVHICGLSFLSMLATRLLGDRVFVRFPGPPSFRTQLWCLKNTYAVIANGDAFNSIQRRAPEANLIRLDVGINHAMFRKTDSIGQAREALGLPKDRVLALFVGRLVPIKNVSMLVRAMGHVAAARHDVDLVLVGDGPERRALEDESEHLGLTGHIHFVGNASGERLRACYTAADLFVLSSRYDNFPNVVLEAMAMELPVVATRVGGVTAQVEHGVTGYLVAPDDDRDMARHILVLAAAPEGRKAFGRTGAAIVHARHDWRKTAEKFIHHVNILPC